MLRYLVLGAIFYVLTPGILLSLPKGGSKKMTALTHAIVFVGAYYLAERLAEMLTVKKMEGFRSIRYQGETKVGDISDLKNAYNNLSFDCQVAKKLKDVEYRRSGDNSAEFRRLDREQGRACDAMNDAANKLHDIGIATSFSWW